MWVCVCMCAHMLGHASKKEKDTHRQTDRHSRGKRRRKRWTARKVSKALTKAGTGTTDYPHFKAWPVLIGRTSRHVPLQCDFLSHWTNAQHKGCQSQGNDYPPPPPFASFPIYPPPPLLSLLPAPANTVATLHVLSSNEYTGCSTTPSWGNCTSWTALNSNTF